MIPQGGVFQSNPRIAAARQPGKTYRLDLVNKRIAGMTDGLEAVKQAVWKILQTERFEHIIYSTNYGSELAGLIGNDEAYVKTELSRRLSEALQRDDRVMDVQELQASVAGDEVLVQFTVVSLYGSFQVEREVNAYV